MDVEAIGEEREEFREKLTLGLITALGNIMRQSFKYKFYGRKDVFSSERIPGVQDVMLEETNPCDNIAITSWEQRYSTVLPHEIKDFYLATDGFKLTWNYNHAGEDFSTAWNVSLRCSV